MGNLCNVSIIHGNLLINSGIYRHYQAETLLALAEPTKLDVCEELADYCTDMRTVTAQVANQRSNYYGK